MAWADATWSELPWASEAEAGGGSVSLVIADALHAHAADSVTLTTESVLSVDDATHGHAADNLTLTVSLGGITLVIQDATHAQIADALTLTTDSLLAVADAFHGHTADNITFAEALGAAYVRALLSIGSTGGTVTLQHRSATGGTDSTLKQDLFYLKRRTIN